jgi:hypothetical protein
VRAGGRHHAVRRAGEKISTMTRRFLLFLAVMALLALLMQGFHQLPRWLENYNRQAAPEEGVLDLNES